MRKTSGTWRAAVVLAVAALAVFALALAACGGDDEGTTDEASAGGSTTIVGAGATFPYPLYSKWAEEFTTSGGSKLNYQPIGSGGGIEAITAKTVDFGASDAPLSQEDLDADGLVQFPMTMGGVVAVVNLDGVETGQLRLTGELLARIFAGDVTKWNDPAIAAENSGVQLPGDKITVVHRSDGSGTTWIFTHYLEAVAPDAWTFGADKEVAWPTGVGGKGNDGVAASVQQLKGSIGYVEYAYAKQNDMAVTQLQNKDGEYVDPSLESFKAAADQADWSTEAFAVLLVDLPGAQTWPIVGASFVLVQKEQEDAARAKAMLDYFDWAYQEGGATAESLDYVPVPASGYELVETEAWSQIMAGGSAVWAQ
jgi:phosphate transport system substrate-binding protein